MTVDLVDFLRARLAEDEQTAKAADGQAWEARFFRPLTGPRTTEFIAAHSPARVLLEIEAKRRIVDYYAAQLVDGQHPTPTGEGAGLRFALLSVAAVYADHPDYRKIWTPTW